MRNVEKTINPHKLCLRCRHGFNQIALLRETAMELEQAKRDNPSYEPLPEHTMVVTNCSHPGFASTNGDGGVIPRETSDVVLECEGFEPRIPEGL